MSWNQKEEGEREMIYATILVVAIVMAYVLGLLTHDKVKGKIMEIRAKIRGKLE